MTKVVLENFLVQIRTILMNLLSQSLPHQIDRKHSIHSINSCFIVLELQFSYEW